MSEVHRRGTVPVDVGIGYDNGIQVLVEDAFDREVDVAWQLGIDGQRGLPRLRHAEILAQDCRAAGNGGLAGGIDLLEHLILTGGEAQVGCLLAVDDIRGLTHT